jgi:cytochrome c peroxidase
MKRANNLKNIDVVLKELASDSLYNRLFARAFKGKKRVFTVKNVFRAIAAYERTLVSFGTPYDAYIAGNNVALSAEARRGMDLFFSQQLACATCHKPPLFTDGEMHRVGASEMDTDKGLYEKTGDINDLFFFRTPSLRNVALTAPYCHDGSVASLSDISHPRLPPVSLTTAQQRDLIVFLEHLTDSTALRNPWFQWP